MIKSALWLLAAYLISVPAYGDETVRFYRYSAEIRWDKTVADSPQTGSLALHLTEGGLTRSHLLIVYDVATRSIKEAMFHQKGGTHLTIPAEGVALPAKLTDTSSAFVLLSTPKLDGNEAKPIMIQKIEWISK